jgi:hypothetical protein
MVGITRKEAFIKILSILEDLNSITYTKQRYFTKEKFLDALINTTASTEKYIIQNIK